MRQNLGVARKGDAIVAAYGTTPPWLKLSGAASDAAARGQWQLARELSDAAREAWLNHCESVNGEERVRRNTVYFGEERER
jgi:hypothetical protein